MVGEGGGNPSTVVSAFRIEVSSFKQVHFFNLEGYCQYACALVLYHHNDVESCMILGNLNLQGVGDIIMSSSFCIETVQKTYVLCPKTVLLSSSCSI